MSQFRSEEMSLIQLFVQSDAAHDTLYELGEVGAIQFKDLNQDKSAFQRIFVSDVRKCDDMLRILRFIAETTEEEKGLVRRGTVVPSVTLDELHDRLQELEKEIKQLSVNYSSLAKNEAEFKEHKHVLRKGGEWFQQASRGISFTAPSDFDENVRVEMRSLLDDSEAMAQKAPSMLGHIAGCIPTANIRDFGLTLFRATRGNMLLRHEEISDSSLADPKSGEAVKKSVFIVFFSGERSRSKIDKIADSYGATKYRLPETLAQQEQLAREIDERLRDLRTVLSKSSDYRRGRLEQVLEAVETWTERVKREKAVFHTLNMFNYDVTHKCLIAEGWCATSQITEIREALRRGGVRSGASVQTVLNVVRTRETPPTYFRNNKLTSGFQAIVDAYGIARYQEFNPATFSVITFPFLFGVMFGDIGHGFLMAMVAGLICLNENRLTAMARDEMFGTIYYGRYNILLMGIFATYSGFIYNELFSVPQPYFAPTSWCGPDDADPVCRAVPGASNTSAQKWVRSNLGQAWDFKTQVTKDTEVTWEVYPFGTDPGWAGASNKLNSVNSFKMKFAIIMGVTQMVAGIFCKLMNTIYFKDWITLRVVFIPEILFINCIFGYLCCLIMIKWTTNWDATYVLNNNGIVSIPQVYCLPDLSNLPCWTPPYHLERDTIPGYGPRLAELPEHQWCMLDGVATAGCAVMEMASGRLLVESNVFGSKELIDPLQYNTTLCDQDPTKCILFKQVPPSLLDSLIKMFMNIGTVPAYDQLVSGQGGLQSNLILVAVLSVPVMLVAKPYLMKWKHQKLDAQKAERAAVRARASSGHTPMKDEDEHEEEEGHGGGHGGHGHGEFDFGEEMVHQMIHTIEFVLACISNTASYLRLWALSLAHAQLSEVFWEKAVVEIGVESASPVMLFVTSSAWACFTVGVLMGMESLSAFLHALRLHWVEYMGKFYSGTGVKFQPFSFADMAAASAVTQDSDD